MARRKYVDRGVVVVDDPRKVEWIDAVQRQAVLDVPLARDPSGRVQRILKLIAALSAVEKIRLLEQVLPQIERELRQK